MFEFGNRTVRVMNAKCAKCNIMLYSINGQDLVGAECGCEVCEQFIEWGEILMPDGSKKLSPSVLRDFPNWKVFSSDPTITDNLT